MAKKEGEDVRESWRIHDGQSRIDHRTEFPDTDDGDNRRIAGIELRRGEEVDLGP